MNSPGKQRKSAKGQRTRLDRANHPESLIAEAPDLTDQQLGFTTANVQDFLGSTPKDLIAAHHRADKLAAKWGEHFEAQWFLKTPWLCALEIGQHDGPSPESRRNRPSRANRALEGLPIGRSNAALVRYAMLWRPRYLAALALTRSQIIACKVATVSQPCVLRHRRDDPDFAAQCDAAEEHAVELLHDACFASALEGDCEPVYWQGIRVGHVRKFDSRLRIEMLRAYKPDRFKRDNYGGQVSVHTGPGSQVLVIGPEEQQQLIAARRASLLRLQAAHSAGEQPLTVITDDPA